MKRIIFKVGGFTKNQKVFIEENGELTSHEIPVDNLARFILTSKCDEVYMYGNENFLKKFQEIIGNNFENSGIIWKYNDPQFLKKVKEKTGE